jgi:hypothetical protein
MRGLLPQEAQLPMPWRGAQWNPALTRTAISWSRLTGGSGTSNLNIGLGVCDIGSDYPHAEGVVRPMEKARRALARLPEVSIKKLLGDNAAQFFGL